MGMTDATDELRRMLDERGVGHTDAEDGHTQHTWWSDGDHEIGASNSGERLAVYNLTPEQAIAATLGCGECHNECKATEFFFYCSECGCAHLRNRAYVDMPRYCPNCGRKVVTDG